MFGVKHSIAILAGCILLFVVVCPITPTPTAVPGGKALSVQVPVVAMAAIVALAPSNSERPLWNALPYEIPSASSTSIVDLTCARLC
jgi:hypothetical protein